MHITRRNVLQQCQCRTSKYFFTTNSIIIINRFLNIFEIVIVQNLATRYVTMFLLQKNVPNFKVIRMFIFAYYTTALITIYRAANIQRNGKIFARN